MYAVLWVTWVTVATTDQARGSQEPHCNMTVEEVLTDWDLMPWSCRTRCGEAYSQQPCACDHRCQLYTDCCDDFTAFCGNTSTSTTMTDAGISGQMNHSMSMKTLMGTVDCRHRTKFISRCPTPPLPLSQTPLLYGGKRITPDGVAPLCDTPPEEAEDEDVNQAMPVTDAASGHHFANIYCLLCHGASVEDAMPWSLSFVLNLKRIRNTVSPQGIREVLQLAREKKVTTLALPPPHVTPRRCIPRNILYDFPCNCPNLAHECETASSSVISVDRKHILWHPSCAACLFVQRNKGYELRKPNIELLVLMKNGFEFVVTMKWTSGQVNAGNASLELASTSSNTLSFAWKHMTCNLSDKQNDSEKSRGDLKTSRQREQDTHAPENANLPQNKATVAGAETADSTDDPSIQSTTSDASVSCSHNRCANGIPMVKKTCQANMSIALIHVLMTCSELDENRVSSSRKPVRAYSLQPEVIADITQSMQQYISTQMENTDVAEVTATRNLDGCFWNTTVTLHKPAAIKLTSDVQEAMLNQSYPILRSALQEATDELSHTLHVCGFMEERLLFNTGSTKFGPCCLSTLLWPPTTVNAHSPAAVMETHMHVIGLTFVILFAEWCKV